MRWEYIAVYIMANKRNGTLYLGVTSNLPRRGYEHRDSIIEGFTKKYGVHMLVYYESHENMEAAIHREKRLKKYTRKAKIALIEKMNPEWKDLYETLL
jgi:putative endonuclease